MNRLLIKAGILLADVLLGCAAGFRLAADRVIQATKRRTMKPHGPAEQDIFVAKVFVVIGIIALFLVLRYW